MKKLSVGLNILKVISLVIALLSIFFMVYVLVDLNARVNAGEYKGLDNLAYVIVIIYSGIANLISFVISLVGLIIASVSKKKLSAQTCEEQDCGAVIASRKRVILHFVLIIVLVLIATAFMFFVGPGLLPKA